MANCRVYLINEDQRVLSLHLLEALDHLAWHGTNIGPPVGGQGGGRGEGEGPMSLYAEQINML